MTTTVSGVRTSSASSHERVSSRMARCAATDCGAGDDCAETDTSAPSDSNPQAIQRRACVFPRLITSTSNESTICRALSGDAACLNSTVEIINRANRSDQTRLPRQAHQLAKAVDAFDAGAVSAENACRLVFLQLGSGPGKLLISGSEEVKAANGGVNGSGTQEAARILKRVDDAGMPAARKQDEAVRSVEDERLIVGDVVLDPSSAVVHFGGC